MAYITKTELKEWLGIPSADTTDSDILDDFVLSAQQDFETRTGYIFEAGSDTTRTFDAERDVRGLTLRFSTPLAAITTVTNGDSNVVAGTDYITEPQNSVDGPYYAITLKRSKGLTWTYTDDPEGAISILGRWAYMTTPTDEIKTAVKEIGAWQYRRRRNAPELDRAVVAGNATFGPQGFPMLAHDIIKKYKKRR